MTITLTAPLKWTNATHDELLLLQSLQGNILKGHGREFANIIFFQFDTNKKLESRRLLRELANYHITNAHRQLIDAENFKQHGKNGGGFTHLALSFAGYEALGLASVAPTDVDFRAGMKAASSISALVDPAVTDWEPPFRQDIHGVLLAAQDTEYEAAVLTAALLELLGEAGCSVLHIQHGQAVRNSVGDGIEHFGYVDGRSQPLMLVEDIEKEVASAGTSRWDPAFPLSTALIKDSGTQDTTSFGSYFVFRKLEQAVRNFKTREQEVANLLGLTGEARELAGALIVGRFEDGTPVTLSNEARGETPPNNFNYAEDAGTRCPFHAHIRKTNPRGTGGAEPEALERGHIMPRRGIPFEDQKRITHPAELADALNMAEFNDAIAPKLPVDGVGLLFMAYNHDIGKQFKFTQQIWVNNSGFPLNPPGPHGIDPIIGQGVNVAGEQKLSTVWDSPSAPINSNCAFSGFVTMKGGEYFFSPSLTFLRNL